MVTPNVAHFRGFEGNLWQPENVCRDDTNSGTNEGQLMRSWLIDDRAKKTFVQSIAFISKSDKQERSEARRGLRRGEFWNLTKARASHGGDDLVMHVAAAARLHAVEASVAQAVPTAL